ncbi:hypothetical protein HN592_05510 [Candidatus Woesearchaeota archaeon]|jgi:hypothetical protein|nr:hypothetical protein [Candidatus Woesearchaeota archaeon]MBT4367949.1 hypothetical protein [Candidatus Woesearchaeota archaeon]MBT4712437.1 hypothetical protein [Candidatus Woesearchaeota archaeon]MBT6639349.1 hypothetical protein [Candidatus Woesearchaeota archaeon]MBT7133522.1 hypothetical protein [Candidatus Woesearchaeota archaeon]
MGKEEWWVIDTEGDEGARTFEVTIKHSRGALDGETVTLGVMQILEFNARKVEVIFTSNLHFLPLEDEMTERAYTKFVKRISLRTGERP